MKEQSTEVLILGMHRSGTSMIGGVLKTLGVNLGQDSPGIQISNPLGHFEDAEFLKLNNAILRRAGGEWDSPPDTFTLDTLVGEYRSSVKDLVQSRARENKNKIWGWKDPRTSLTAGFYLPFLKNPYIIWCNRFPDDIAASLWKRNKISRQDSMELISKYQHSINKIIAEYSNLPLLKLNYHEVVQDPEYWVKEICDFLHLSVNDSQESKAVQIILPNKNLARKKLTVQVKHLLSLPSRAYRKFILEKR